MSSENDKKKTSFVDTLFDPFGNATEGALIDGEDDELGMLLMEEKRKELETEMVVNNLILPGSLVNIANLDPYPYLIYTVTWSVGKNKSFDTHRKAFRHLAVVKILAAMKSEIFSQTGVDYQEKIPEAVFKKFFPTKEAWTAELLRVRRVLKKNWEAEHNIKLKTKMDVKLVAPE